MVTPGDYLSDWFFFFELACIYFLVVVPIRVLVFTQHNIFESIETIKRSRPFGIGHICAHFTADCHSNIYFLFREHIYYFLSSFGMKFAEELTFIVTVLVYGAVFIKYKVLREDYS